jgi:hypothetical protein
MASNVNFPEEDSSPNAGSLAAFQTSPMGGHANTGITRITT